MGDVRLDWRSVAYTVEDTHHGREILVRAGTDGHAHVVLATR